MKQVCFEDALDAYIRFREVSRLSMTTVKHLRYMLSFCKKEYPGDPWLTQDKIDRWGARRPKESGTTQASRVGSLNAFIEYLNRRNDFLFSPVPLEKKMPAWRPRPVHGSRIAQFLPCLRRDRGNPKPRIRS